MSKIIKTTDFVGIYAISQNSNSTTVLQSYIDKYETLYIYDLLGKELGDLFLADISPAYSNPATLKYLTIYNSLSIDFINNEVRSNGIKEMLIGFIYFEYVRKNTVKNTLVGNIIAANEVSTQSDWNNTNIYLNYNEAVRTYNSIQTYIEQNLGNYPEYNGNIKKYSNWAI
jgi:hypothetical protein